ncbi:MAG: NDP-4-keto-2,6-dideoxyhexose 3-C-methyltransferase [Gammaproteobacteria bacterium]
MFKSINKCRVCGNGNLVTVLELGEQVLTGVFPKSIDTQITRGPLTLVKCVGSGQCGLLQLGHTYPMDEIYGENYGYRSGLNPSMVDHLKSKVEKIKSLGIIEKQDFIVDIGSNDATTLKHYALDDCNLVGIDPTANKFKEYYTDNIQLIPDFFSAADYLAISNGQKAKVITTFSMFYDLDNPLAFMREIADILEDDGVWVFEQSYMPLMLTTNSYDTVCHEHLEYYSLSQIMWMTEHVGMKIIDVELNNVNGGSFSVIAQKTIGNMSATTSVQKVIDSEISQSLDDLQIYVDFALRVTESKNTLLNFFENAKCNGRTVSALGASTKGNVILQYCDIDPSMIESIGEVNSDKYGAFTPGTNIPIVNEEIIIARRPDYVIVLPWHFRKYFESQRKYSELNLVYPLPKLSVG